MEQELKKRFETAYYHVKWNRPAHARLHLLHARRLLEPIRNYHPDYSQMLEWMNLVEEDIRLHWKTGIIKMDAMEDIAGLILDAHKWCDEGYEERRSA